MSCVVSQDIFTELYMCVFKINLLNNNRKLQLNNFILNIKFKIKLQPVSHVNKQCKTLSKEYPVYFQLILQ